MKFLLNNCLYCANDFVILVAAEGRAKRLRNNLGRFDLDTAPSFCACLDQQIPGSADAQGLKHSGVERMTQLPNMQALRRADQAENP
ncbi:MAG: hypothetical protein Q8O52_00265 [Sulfuritalea sp.]|nr:hypothetical protein [Sulfuritalea sp.]